jgi:hypothetical protein
MASRDQVKEFLALFEGATMLGNYQVKGREKNIQALLDMGLSPNEQREIILGLTPDNYVAGPKPDDTDDTKEVWEFGVNVEGTDVYVKLRVAKDPTKQHVYHALVWSFHPAEYRLRYPLREEA